MKGYIYITGTGADPAARANLNDPTFGRPPTLGACMPNIRRLVIPGDYIFVISGKIPTVQQYVIGGMRVNEKIDALSAYDRFPSNRLHRDSSGKVVGNIIVTPDGAQHPLDNHSSSTFDRRVRDFIVGDEAVSLKTSREVEIGRRESLGKLSDLLGRRGNRVIDVVSRWSKLDGDQVESLLGWLRGIKGAAKPG